MTLGVPLAGHFQCSFASVAKRNLYNNHDTIKTPEVEAAVRQKFVKEEELSYNVVFQRWIWRYIAGMFLNLKNSVNDLKLTMSLKMIVSQPYVGMVLINLFSICQWFFKCLFHDEIG